MKLDRAFILSFVAPLMILISITGLSLNKNSKKIFYLPLGLTGIFIILEKNVSRKLNRQKVFKKIKSFQKLK